MAKRSIVSKLESEKAIQDVQERYAIEMDNESEQVARTRRITKVLNELNYRDILALGKIIVNRISNREYNYSKLKCISGEPKYHGTLEKMKYDLVQIYKEMEAKKKGIKLEEKPDPMQFQVYLDQELKKESEKLFKPMCKFFANQRLRKLEKIAMEKAVVKECEQDLKDEE